MKLTRNEFFKTVAGIPVVTGAVTKTELPSEKIWVSPRYTYVKMTFFRLKLVQKAHLFPGKTHFVLVYDPAKHDISDVVKYPLLKECHTYQHLSAVDPELICVNSNRLLFYQYGVGKFWEGRLTDPRGGDDHIGAQELLKGLDPR